MSPNLLTSQRLYARLRRDLERGRFAPGTQLPLAELARELGTSVQPVRDVLARLVGERILSLYPGGGFQTPLMSARETRDLVDWHAHLLRLVLRGRRPNWHMPDMSDAFVRADSRKPPEVADLAARVFTAIADASDNVEHVEAIRSANIRLFPLWLRDSAGAATVHELQTIAAATVSGSQSAIKSAVWAYQRRQQRRVRHLFEDRFVEE